MEGEQGGESSSKRQSNINNYRCKIEKSKYKKTGEDDAKNQYIYICNIYIHILIIYKYTHMKYLDDKISSSLVKNALIHAYDDDGYKYVNIE